MLSSSNPNALPPFPDSQLINDGTTASLNIQPNNTYKISVIGMQAFAATIISFDSHTLQIIEVDGVYTEKQEATVLRVAPAQRYSFLLTAEPVTTRNYAFTAILDENRDYTAAGAVYPLNATGYLVYDSSNETPSAYTLDTITPLDDTTLVPTDGQSLISGPDRTITLDFKFGLDSLSIPR
jgi:iron transport multicopper oxidase